MKNLSYFLICHIKKVGKQNNLLLFLRQRFYRLRKPVILN